MKSKALLIKLHWLFATLLGFDPRILLRSILGLPKYIRNRAKFRMGYTGRMEFVPCLNDLAEEAGATKSEYFWQDLYVARAVHEAKPQKHVDIGSRVDGFVAHIASFRDCEVFDIRPITSQIPGVIFRKVDIMKAETLPHNEYDGYCDSISCLHALEHFGLGRYGDKVDPQGYKHGISNIVKLLKRGGRLYLSTPIGQERVEFDANWVFDPRKIIQEIEFFGLKLESLILITPDGVKESASDKDTLIKLSLSRYTLAMLLFVKE